MFMKKKFSVFYLRKSLVSSFSTVYILIMPSEFRHCMFGRESIRIIAYSAPTCHPEMLL